MNAIIPTIHAIIPVIPKVLPWVQSIYGGETNTGTMDLGVVQSLVNQTSQIHLGRIDDPKIPVLKKDKDGNDMRLMIWGHPKDVGNLDYIVALICKKRLDSKGQDVYVPERLIRGAKANVLIVGGMSCCGTSLQTHWTHISNVGGNIDSGRIPLAGLPHPEHANWLVGKIHLADANTSLQAKAILEHMIMDVMAVRFPSHRDFLHKCNGGYDYMGFTNRSPG